MPAPTNDTRTHLPSDDGGALCGVTMPGDHIEADPARVTETVDCVACMWKDMGRIIEAANQERRRR